LAIVVVVAHAVAVDIVPAALYPEAQAEQVPLPSGKHAAHKAIEVAAPEIVFLQRTQPVPVTKVYPIVQVTPVATVVPVHVAAPVAQATQAPETT